MRTNDLIVVGGGLVGVALAYGAARSGAQVTVLDEGDDAFRASRGNFGLVWVQGKGYGMAPYARWSMRSSRQWPALAATLLEESGVDVQLHQPGGFHFCFSAEEMQERHERLQRIRDDLDGDYHFEMLGHDALKQRLPGIGPTVAGASYTPMDGHANPLKLLRALHTASQARGVQVHGGGRVTEVTRVPDGYEVEAGGKRYRAARIVMAAGLGNRVLAEKVGLHAPVVPNRGQVLVGERVPNFSTIRRPTCARPTRARSSSAIRWKTSAWTTARLPTCWPPSHSAASAPSPRSKACGWSAPGAHCG